MKKTAKFILFFVLTISLGLLTGCEKVIRITNFHDMKDLPKNPTRIVFGTNSQNYDNENERYGDPIEYEIAGDKIAEIVDKLFAIRYEAYPDYVDIDLSPIVRYLVFYNDDGVTWTVYLGLIWHNERWYYPIDNSDLITFLYELIGE